MFTTAISQHAAKSLAVLGKSGILAKGYLAGGTACALYLGHRFSFDLDFFTNKEFSTVVTVKNLQTLPGFTLTQTVKWTILGTFPETKFSYFYYPYPLIGKTTQFSHISIASLEDIAAMKIAAICDRGTKRDFIDLYIIIQQKLSLDKVLELYDKKYKMLANNLYTIITSLRYFRDAEGENLQMIEKISWEEVKEFFTKETIRLTRKFIE